MQEKPTEEQHCEATEEQRCEATENAGEDEKKVEGITEDAGEATEDAVEATEDADEEEKKGEGVAEDAAEDENEAGRNPGSREGGPNVWEETHSTQARKDEEGETRAGGQGETDECWFEGAESDIGEEDGFVIGASAESESVRIDEQDPGGLEDDEAARGSSESFMSCADLGANCGHSRPMVEALFGPGGEDDARGGPLSWWVRHLRDEGGALSTHHQEMTHQGVWAEEPLPESEQGPGQQSAGSAENDYMQTYTGGYVVVHHCRQRQELFYPGGVGFPVDPARLRNERMTVCRCSTGVLARTGSAMTIEDNWREVGPHKMVAGGGWWSGLTVFVLQGRALPWESPQRREEGEEGGDEETTDEDPELGDGELSPTTIETTATRASRSRSRSARRAAGSGVRKDRVEELAEDYLRILGELDEPTPSAWASVLQSGDALLNGAGSVKIAAEALWKVRERLGFNNLKGVKEKVVEEVLHPDMVEYLRSVEKHGMPARHEGERSRVASNLHPNAKKHLDQVYKQIWKDVRKRRVLVVRKANPLLQDTISSPFEAVDKMLPDRTIAPDKRVVHDQRQVNTGSDKTWHPPALQPTHQQVARRVVWCRSRYPGPRADCQEGYCWGLQTLVGGSGGCSPVCRRSTVEEGLHGAGGGRTRKGHGRR